MSKEIVVVETLKAVQGQKDGLRRALAKLVPISRKAPGCLQYDLLEPADKNDEFLILMRWRKLDDLRDHETSDYIENFVREHDQILYDEVKVTEWYQVKV